MTDNGWAWCIAAGLIVGFGIVPAIAGEIRFRRAMKAARERAERERQALAQQASVDKRLLSTVQIYGSTARATMIDNFLTMTAVDATVPVPPPQPPPVPPTLDVLAATAQQNPERWKDFLDV